MSIFLINWRKWYAPSSHTLKKRIKKRGAHGYTNRKRSQGGMLKKARVNVKETFRNVKELHVVTQRSGE